MTQTFSTIEVEGKHWLAPEPVIKAPDYPKWQLQLFLSYNKWIDEKSGWIEIKEEHAKEFEGRTGLIEAIDFQLIREISTTEGWQKAVERWLWDYAPEKLRRMVAVPIGEKEVQAKNRAAEYGDLDKDLVIYALEEASEQWKAEYDNCRAILQELVDLKIMKDEKGDSMEYRFRKPLAWIAAKNFLKKYQHQ